MRQTPAIVTEISALTPSCLRLVVSRTDGLSFPAFVPGQYATLSFPRYRNLRGERSFSIASSAIASTELEFGIRIGGKYTKQLARLVAGDQVNVAAPFGQFTFSPEHDQYAVFIAGGIGITPFMSMIRTAADAGWTNDLRLLYSVRSLAEAAYLAELQELEQRLPNFHVWYVVGDGVFRADAKNCHAGRITPELMASVVEENPWGRTFFVCGPPAFMNAATSILHAFGLPAAVIRSERFAVASSAIIEPGSPMPKLAFAAWGVATAIVLAAVVRIEHDRRLASNAASSTTSATTSAATTPSANVPATTVNTNTDTSIPTTAAVTPAPVTTPSPTTTTTPTPVTVTTPTYTPPVTTYTPPVYYPRTRTS